MSALDPKDFGARGDGLSLDTQAIQAAIDRAGERGGGRVALGPGVWLSGALQLRSGVEFRLEAGATLLGSADPADYPLVSERWEGETRQVHAPLIGGTGLRNVGLLGPGLIDGGGKPWWDRFREGSLDAPRPRLVAFESCERVSLGGFMAVNSPSWTINPVRCRDVLIHGLTIRNPDDSPNTDGIDPDSCRDVRISDCLVDVGDDCIAIKSGTEFEKPELRSPSERVVIVNCVFRAGHGGVVIGSEMSGDVRDVLVSNCVFHGTDRGIRLKSRRGRGGRIENLRASNLIMRDVMVPFAVNMHYACGAWGNPEVADKGVRPMDEGTPRIRDIDIRGVSATGVTVAAGFVYGLGESPIEDLRLRDWDVRIEAGLGEPRQAEMGDGLPDLRASGLLARRVRGLRLRDFDIRGQEGPAFDLTDCEDVTY